MFRFTALLAGFLLFSALLYAQDNPWQDAGEDNLQLPGERVIQPDAYRVIQLDEDNLRAMLEEAPLEFTPEAERTEIILSIPMPGGDFQRFRIFSSPIMADELARKYPQLQTWSGYGIDDRTASLRFSLTHKGFHASILSANGTVYIDPLTKANTGYYQTYFTRDHRREDLQWRCHVHEDRRPTDIRPQDDYSRAQLGDCQLRTYRIAIAANVEYSTYHGGNVPDVLAEIMVALNRVNGIYERELAVRMQLIADNDDIVFLSEPDGYTNNDPDALLNENQDILDDEIGGDNYDIGHVFTTGGGGKATLRVVCENGAKARGETGLSVPEGDRFYVDYVAHEIGHQFGGNHTFNGDTGSCNGNRNNGTAYEPGSGSTIMAYADICSGENVQGFSDDYFHRASLKEITDYITTGDGDGCPVKTALSNNPPSITGTGGATSWTIPYSTPFCLTGSATDPDNDALTYCWEQYDNGIINHPPQSTADKGPVFRSLQPSTSPTRYFPNLPDLADGVSPTWEVLPSVARDLSFRLSVRDRGNGPGCVDDTGVDVTVADTGPFEVTSQSGSNIIYQGGSSQTVTWDVAGTDAAPINCSEVDILLSTDGGHTFDQTILSGTPNDGSASVSLPGINSDDVRLMVKCSDNIFFNINGSDFTVDNSPPDLICPVNLSFSLDETCAYELPDLTGLARVSDNFDPSPTVSQSPTPQTFEGPQDITITLTATDQVGNSSECTFMVTLEDNSPPLAKAKDITVTLEVGSGEAVITPTDVDDGSEDNCADPPTLTLDKEIFTCLDVGENIVVLTADDENGNTDTDIAVVTVQQYEFSADAGDCDFVYFGYAPEECTDLSVSVSGGKAPFTYAWDNGETSATITVCPEVNTTYSVTITDANGCTTEDDVLVEAIDVRCGNNLDKVEICHSNPNKPGNAKTLCVSANSVPSHLAHGDHLASCGTVPCADFDPLPGDEFAINRPKHTEVMANTPGLLVFPNPANQILQLDLSDWMEEEVSLFVVNALGQTVWGREIDKVNDPVETISLNGFADGLFFLVLKQEGSPGQVARFVVDKNR